MLWEFNFVALLMSLWAATKSYNYNQERENVIYRTLINNAF